MTSGPRLYRKCNSKINKPDVDAGLVKHNWYTCWA